MIKSSPFSTSSPATGLISADFATAGSPIPALDRLRIMSPGTWTDFVLEWADSLKTRYVNVERCDGAGDMGRDVIAFVKLGQTDPWDNYQCKYYDHSLMPGDIWLELGKLCYYTHIGAFSIPRFYYFVAPQGAGAKLSSLFRSPMKLRDGLLAKWDETCLKGITSTKNVPLDATLMSHIQSFDFSIFTSPSPLKIIEEHRQTRWHVARFGGGLPIRPLSPAPPDTIAAHEANYVRALLDAYEDKTQTQIQSLAQLADATLVEHFKRSRQEFYMSEALKGFSRDNVPPGTFDALLADVHSGVIDVVQATHPDAYERVLATVRQSKTLPLTSSPLVKRITSADKGGMCHQLANDKTVRWKP